MGSRLAVGSARQHSHLTAVPTAPWAKPLALGALAFDGFLSAVAAALFLPLYIGPVPFPISALISGLVNAALVWTALQWTSAPRVAALPLWVWLATVGALTLGGPGDDIVFGGVGFSQFGVLILLIVGVAPPAAVLWQHVRPRTG